MNRHYFTVSLIAIIALGLTACSAPSAISKQDVIALKTLEAVAGVTSDVQEDQITSTECWLPSEHKIDDPNLLRKSEWRVLCRVHYRDSSGDRYQDTTCIGDFSKRPMLDHCYRWVYYDFEPRFEDYPAIDTG